MPYNGSGTFYRNYNWVQDYGNGILIDPSRVDNDSNDFANGLTNCITRDGQGKPAANISWNNYQINFLANPTLSTDALNLGYADGRYLRKDGSTVPTASINAGSFTIINVANPVNPTDAMNKQTADASYLNLSGSTPMAGALNMNNFKINNLAAPLSAGDAATKTYVDSVAASGSASTSLVASTIIVNSLGGF